MSKDALERLLEDAPRAAQDKCVPGQKGMASVSLTYDPYECRWQAWADWSDDSRVVGNGSDSPTDAVLELTDVLREGRAQ